MNKLEEICSAKYHEVAARKAALSPSELADRIAAQTAPRGFEAQLLALWEGRDALTTEASFRTHAGQVHRQQPCLQNIIQQQRILRTARSGLPALHCGLA